MKKVPNAALAKTVDEYMNQVADAMRPALEKLRRTIKAAAPKAEEVISYQIPAYKYNGPLVFFAAFPDHCSLFVVNKNLLQRFAKELEGYKTSGTTIHFSPEHPLPASLVQKIVKERMKENEDRTLLPKAKKKVAKATKSA